MIEIILLLSLSLNIFLIWYTRNTLANLLYLSENLGLLYDAVSSFSSHLQAVYELERFYGDATLTNLLEHANALREELEQYENIFLLSEQQEEQEVEPNDNSVETQKE